MWPGFLFYTYFGSHTCITHKLCTCSNWVAVITTLTFSNHFILIFKSLLCFRCSVYCDTPHFQHYHSSVFVQNLQWITSNDKIRTNGSYFFLCLCFGFVFGWGLLISVIQNLSVMLAWWCGLSPLFLYLCKTHLIELLIHTLMFHSLWLLIFTHSAFIILKHY